MRLPSIESIQQSYEHVYVSPHMDDVVLSCSGRIAKQLRKGEAVLAVTVFAGDVKEDKKPRGLDYNPLIDVKRRRAEDAKAMERLGVDYIWLDYPDSIFRLKRPILRFGLHLRATAREGRLCKAVRDDIQKICLAAGNKRLYLPLGVGQHVDHQIIFQTGMQLPLQIKQNIELHFYEEIPYALIPSAVKFRMKLTGIDIDSISSAKDVSRVKAILYQIIEDYAAIKGLGFFKRKDPFLKSLLFFSPLFSAILAEYLPNRRRGLLGYRKIIPEIFDISLTIEQKLAAIAAYSSQLNEQFRNRESLRKFIASYSRGIGGSKGQYLERYWRIIFQ